MRVLVRLSHFASRTGKGAGRERSRKSCMVGKHVWQQSREVSVRIVFISVFKHYFKVIFTLFHWRMLSAVFVVLFTCELGVSEPQTVYQLFKTTDKQHQNRSSFSKSDLCRSLNAQFAVMV